MIAIDILYLVERLEELLNKGWHVPLSSKTMVDADELLDIVDQMRMALPEEIKEARQLQEDRERFLAQTNEEAARILAAAQEDAGRILTLAQEDAARLLDEHVIIRDAMERAAQIENEATSSAAATRKDSDAYAAKVLSELKARLEQMARQVAMLQNQVDNGLNYIAAQSGHAESTPEPEEIAEPMDS